MAPWGLVWQRHDGTEQNIVLYYCTVWHDSVLYGMWHGVAIVLVSHAPSLAFCITFGFFHVCTFCTKYQILILRIRNCDFLFNTFQLLFIANVSQGVYSVQCIFLGIQWPAILKAGT